MATVTVDYSELDRIRRVLGDVRAAEFAVPAAADLLDEWKRASVAAAPEGETRELVDGIRVESVTVTSDGAAGEIVSAAGHSGFVNFGTTRQAPQPYFTIGAMAVTARLTVVERTLSDALSKKLGTG